LFLSHFVAIERVLFFSVYFSCSSSTKFWTIRQW